MDGSTKFLIPNSGLIVRDPISKTQLAEAGEWKTIIGPAGRYWRRRISCGDVIVGEPVVVAPIVSKKFSRD
jgi:hypothetical protein